jgi:GMP synthase-like glutamine amidotransferase
MKKVIVFQHVHYEDLEKIEEYLLKKNLVIEKIRLFENEDIPKDLSQFSLMISLGGPMDTWMIKQYPWIIKEKNAIKEFVINLEKPFIGICLGCQLLGEVLGGKIQKSKFSEIGFFNLRTKERIYYDKNLNFFPKKVSVFQWHSYEVCSIRNSNIENLATSSCTENQLFRYKSHAYGLQFHFEVDLNTIEKWLKEKTFKITLEKIFGDNPLKTIKKKYLNEFDKMNLLCEKFILNLIKSFNIS